MTTRELLDYYYDADFALTTRIYNETKLELSNKQTMFCICGKLATGLHEDHCSKFKKKVEKETVKKLQQILRTNEQGNKTRNFPAMGR